MKIATVTFHCAYNYGAVLQAYSLVCALNKMGHEAQVLDYWPRKRLDDASTVWIKKNPLKIVPLVMNLLTAINYRAIVKKKSKFDLFRMKNLPTSVRTYGAEAEIGLNPPDVDVYITGSDQVWNPEKGIDSTYFLSFVKNLGKKSIAYAPSIGLPEIPSEYCQKMGELISNVDFLSSRERRGAELIKTLTGRNAETVVDPVFLQTEEDWRRITGEPLVRGKYIFVYVVRRRAHMEREIAKLKKMTNLPVVLVVGANPAARGFIPADQIFWDAGPIDFVNLISNATYVCTNSFHGTAFSIIFQKPFFSFTHTDGDSRVRSILERIGEIERMITPGQVIGNIDETPIHSARLKNEINKSFSYLNEALS